MNLEEKKAILMRVVEDADDRLTGLLIALGKEYNDAEEYFSEEELNSFEETRQAFFNSNNEGSTVEEAHARIRSNFKEGI